MRSAGNAGLFVGSAKLGKSMTTWSFQIGDHFVHITLGVNRNLDPQNCLVRDRLHLLLANRHSAAR